VATQRAGNSSNARNNRTSKNNTTSRGNSSRSNTASRSNNGTRSNGTRSKNSSRNNAHRRKKTTKAQRVRRKAIFNESATIISVAIALLIFLSNFGLCGKFGSVVSDYMFGFFGLLAYIFPIFFVISLGFATANRNDRTVVNKVTVAYVLFVFCCAAFHLLFMDAGNKAIKTSKYFEICANDKSGGGVLGAAITESLLKVFAISGTCIIEVAIIIVCIVIISEKSIINGVKRGGSHMARKAMELRNYDEDEIDLDEYLKETKPARFLKKRQKRRGVSMDTKIGQDKTNLDIHEIDGNLDTPEVFADNIKIVDSGDLRRTSEDENPAFAPADFTKVRESMNGEHKDSTKENSYDEEGLFKPKEKIEVSKKAKEVMSRPAYATTQPSVQAMASNEEKTAKEVVNPDMTEVNPSPETKKEKINTALETNKVTSEISKKKEVKNYVLPPISLLKSGSSGKHKASKDELVETAKKLELVLEQFGVNAKVTDISRGPSVTRYELQPEFGTKVSKITSLSDDIKLNLAAEDIRIEAPIPGKAAVGIEIPNSGRDMVSLRELLEDEKFKNTQSKIAFPAGLDIAGEVIIGDIAKMPHLLVAGTTGSGKSVFTNSIIMSVLFRAKPDEVKLLIVDPKVVEFGVYNGIPHLLLPVVTDPKKAAGALSWAVGEMTKRYKKFASIGVKDLSSFNQRVTSEELTDDEGNTLEKMPQILIVIDELADLMMAAAKEVEESICRLAQLARAAGIHLVIATQRPSVDVVTGLIKANISSRVALLVSSGTDSRTIIDMNGAEKLLGHGDMLFYPSGYVKPVRVQGAYVSEEEILKTVTYLKNKNGETEYDTEMTQSVVSGGSGNMAGSDNDNDELFVEAGKFVIEKQKASTSMLQRVFRIGFNRAARIMDQLYEAGVVGAEEGTKPRKVVMSMAEFEELISK